LDCNAVLDRLPGNYFPDRGFAHSSGASVMFRSFSPKESFFFYF
jgi:hypothetical protein